MSKRFAALVILIVASLGRVHAHAQVQQTFAALGAPNIFTLPNQFTASIQSPTLTNSGNTLSLTSSGISVTDLFGNLIVTNNSSMGIAFHGGGTGNGAITLSATGVGAALELDDNNGNGCIFGASGIWPWNINCTNINLTAGLINTSGSANYIYGSPLTVGVNSTPGSLGSISNGFTISTATTNLVGTLTLPGMSGTTCLEQVNGVITNSGSACGGGGGGGVTGSGSINTIPLWTGATVIGNSEITDNAGAGGFTYNGVSGDLFTVTAPNGITLESQAHVLTLADNNGEFFLAINGTTTNFVYNVAGSGTDINLYLFGHYATNSTGILQVANSTGLVTAITGFSGTKVAGSCTLTINDGLITGVSGC